MRRITVGATIASLALGAAIVPGAGAKTTAKKPPPRSKTARADLRTVGASPAGLAAPASGRATLTDEKKHDRLSINVRGLLPGVRYSWHLHRAAAGVADPCVAPLAGAAPVAGWIYRPLVANNGGQARAEGRSFTFIADPAATYYADVHAPDGTVLLCGVFSSKRRKGDNSTQPPATQPAPAAPEAGTGPPAGDPFVVGGPPAPPAPGQPAGTGQPAGGTAPAWRPQTLRAQLGVVGPRPYWVGQDNLGKAELRDEAKQDRLSIDIRGLRPGVTYGWHLHKAAVGTADPCAAPSADAASVPEWIYQPLSANKSGAAHAQGQSFTFAGDATSTYYVDVHAPDGAVVLCGVLVK